MPILKSLLLLAAASLLAAAEMTSPAGLWKTIDDKTGRPRGLIRIYQQGGAFFGKIEKSLVPGEPADRICAACKDDRKGQPVNGMVIIRNMRPQDGEYRGGDILDPDSGTVYRCKLQLIEGGSKLNVRGFLGFSLIGRTQTWVREAASPVAP